jgi:hypothetical protein
MNAKYCKKMRKVARAMSQGQPERRLVIVHLGVKQYEIGGEKRSIQLIRAGNDPHTFRGVYRSLKRGIRLARNVRGLGLA